jgi:hypothetical protein
MSIDLRTGTRGWRRVETSCGKLEYRVDLFLRYFELLDNVAYAAPASSFRTRRIPASEYRRNTHAPPSRPGTLSTAGHWDQSRRAMLPRPSP